MSLLARPVNLTGLNANKYMGVVQDCMTQLAEGNAVDASWSQFCFSLHQTITPIAASGCCAQWSLQSSLPGQQLGWNSNEVVRVVLTSICDAVLGLICMYVQMCGAKDACWISGRSSAGCQQQKIAICLPITRCFTCVHVMRVRRYSFSEWHTCTL